MTSRRKATLIAALTLALGITAGARQTQRQMNEKACAGRAKAEAELNQVYEKILSTNAKDANFIQAFTAAQQAWAAFRDAHLKALYPDPAVNAYGSVNPMCRCTVLEQMTRDRTQQLRELWIRGTIESDACGGSLPIHPQKKPVTAKQPTPAH